MPKYALLGATGASGSAVLRSLLREPPEDLQLDMLVRSESKLRGLFPRLDEHESAIRILKGNSNDVPALEECFRGASAIFICVGSNESKLGMSLVEDTATAVVEALGNLRRNEGDRYSPPSVIQLRTASLNPEMSRHTPMPVLTVVKWALHYLYSDISSGCNILQSAAVKDDQQGGKATASTSPLLKYIFVDSPTMHDPDGTECTGYKFIAGGEHPPILSYADLGAAICELGRRQEDFANQAVGVVATGNPKPTWNLLLPMLGSAIYNRIWGLLTHGK